MRRRQFLGAAAAALAGCLTNASAPGGDGTDTPTDADDTPEGDATFPGTCPSFVDGADRTVCYGDHATAPVYLRPSTRRFEDFAGNGEVETVTFALHNEGETAFRFNPHDWAIKRRTDDGWAHVAPRKYVEPLTDVPPGGRYEWVLGTETHSSPMAENAQAVAVDLESAETYAFRVHGRLTGPDEHVECVARFEYLRAVPSG